MLFFSYLFFYELFNGKSYLLAKRDVLEMFCVKTRGADVRADAFGGTTGLTLQMSVSSPGLVPVHTRSMTLYNRVKDGMLKKIT